MAEEDELIAKMMTTCDDSLYVPEFSNSLQINDYRHIIK
jgi:hypothetical protein